MMTVGQGIILLINLFGITAIAGGLIYIYPYAAFIWQSRTPEAETQFYVIGVALTVLWLLIWNRLSFNKHIERLLLIPSKLKTGVHVPIIAFLVAGEIFLYRFLTEVVLKSGNFTWYLYQIGIDQKFLHPGEMILAFTVGISFIMFYLSRSSPSQNIKLKGLFQASAGVILVLLTFFVGRLNLYDYMQYAGPIHAIQTGSEPLQTLSQYGFLLIIFLTFIFKIIPLKLINLHIIVALVSTTGYLLLYFYLVKIYKDRRWAFFTSILCLLANFLVLYYPYDGQYFSRNHYIGATFMRYGVWFPVGFFILLKDKLTKTIGPFIWRALVWLAVIFSIFWVIDSGIYVCISYIIYISLISAGKNIRTWVRKVSEELIGLGSVFLILLLGVSIFYRFIYRVMPDWSQMIRFMSVRFSRTDAFLTPITPSVWPWIVMAIPLVVIALVMTYKRTSQKPLSPENQAFLFLMSWGAVSFIYYTARSLVGSLHIISIPAVVGGIWLTQHLLIKLRQKTPILLGYTIVFSFLLAIPFSFLSVQAVSNLNQANFLTSLEAIKNPEGSEIERFGPTVSGLKEKYGTYFAIYDPAIISVYDTWYLILLNRVNETGSFCLACQVNPDEVRPYIEIIRKKKSQYIFSDTNTTYFQGQMYWVLEPLLDDYKWIDQIGELNVFERKDTIN
jgi:hypothetical protein